MNCIYLILRLHHGRDDYGSTCREEIANEYGFFTQRVAAQELVDSLGPNEEAKIEEEYQTMLKDYGQKMKAYERRNRELAVLREAHIKPSFSPLCKPTRPVKPVRIQERFYTSHEVFELEINAEEWQDED